MTEADSFECRQLGRELADLEWKLAVWEKKWDVANQIVVGLRDKQARLVGRQREILEGKAKAAGA